MISLSDRTLNILSNYSLINQSLLIEVGNNLATIKECGSLISEAKIQENFESKIVIGDIMKFTGLLNLFDEYDMEIDDTNIKIYDENKEMRYLFSYEEEIMYPKKDVLDKIKAVEYKKSFDLPIVEMKKLKKSTRLLGVDQIQIYGEEGNLYISSQTNSKKLGISNFYRIKVGKTSKDFKIIISEECFRLIENNSYSVHIGFIKEKKPVIKFHNVNNENNLTIDYWMTGILNAR